MSQLTGMLTSIQRFSLNDGPGIRTTVFFKGCNMACAWCHNPETLSFKPELLIYPDRCIGCDGCISVCPSGARYREAGVLVFDRSRCTACGLCAEQCFSGALERAGRIMTPQQVMEDILQDLDYYRNSGGGVTLSGGEAVLQSDFAEALLELCHQHGIKTALETNLNYPFALLDRLLPSLDLIMADIKLLDSARHRQVTGRVNDSVLANVLRLSRGAVPFIIRTPVIPGTNDREEEIEAIAHFLSPLENLQYYELLNFNPLGDSKYEGLGLSNPYSEIRPLPPHRMTDLRDAAAKWLPSVRIG